MDENFNIKMLSLKQNIVKLVGESELPVGVVYYILKDLFEDITNVYNQSIALEKTILENKSDDINNQDDKEQE